MSQPRPTRRAVLAAAAGAALAPACAGSAPVARPRVAAIDWAMLETALALGADVVAGAELILYRRLVVEPTVPGDVADLGLRGSLNFEALLRAAPDLILSAPWYGRLEGNLGRIAPVLSLRIDQRGRPPYAAAIEATRVVAARTGLVGEAERVIAETEAALAAAAQRLAPRRGERLFVISVGDPRHFRAFGPDSMHGAVLDRLGLASAWAGNTCYFAQAPVDITALARDPGAGIVIVGPPPPDAARALPRSALWNALPAVRENRVHVLEPVNPFGALPAAARFARLLAEALA
ncbi:iron complex transport system substrate-binding protein [Methylobacterium sp. ap11]|uniref:ABC transporter substrate-binding protein n=1 Tax=Methylobacterium sp. ap11 TaxID=1761799 RepID=UPI0008CF8DB5|nr:ABC transporter substrate-binding protein [Methylobacterium sp. ap11]SEP41633.1 iron complex transport system substrate-binding protein [Methylobacterium sp. ap11]